MQTISASKTLTELGVRASNFDPHALRTHVLAGNVQYLASHANGALAIMATFNRVSSSKASLSTLLAALQTHLTPTPLLNALPTALQLFAHFQLVSERIKAEAARALTEHDELVRELELSGVAQGDQVAMGALKKEEGRRLRRLAARDEEETMLAFSLEFRKHVSPVHRE